MKLLLLHGPAKIVSRKKLVELKQNFDQNNVVVYEEGSNIQTLLAGLSTPLLFSEPQLIILENPSEDFKLPIANCQLPTTLVLWFDHEVDIKKWPGFTTLLFEESKEISVFPFLDYLAVQDKRAFLEVEKLKQAGFDIFYFLTMVFYLLRNLINTPKNSPNFVKDKLQRQRKNFSQDRLIKLYQDILEIEFKIKSGLLEKDQAEFLLISKLLRA